MSIEYWNGIALIEDDSHFTKWVKETGRLDHHQSFLRSLKPYIKGTVLDIGANIGTHTAFYARYANIVFAFEPNPMAFECLKYNTIKYLNCFVYPSAVANYNGHVDMVSCGTNYGAAYTIPGSEVPCITIDSLHLDSCNYMKIDVEGDELAVLLGAKETIAKYKPVMCIECNEHTLVRKGMSGQTLIDHIHKLGYTTTPHDPRNICSDLICLPVHS